MEYESAKNIEHPKNTPAFDVDAGGRYFVYYADQGIYLFDLMTLTSNEIWSFVDGSVPVWIQFVDTEASSVAVQWADKMLYLTIPEGKPALYENGALSNTVLCTFTKNSVLFVDQEGGLFQWNLSTDKISDELIPRVKLEIEDLKEDRSGNLIVRYSNNCILTIDVDRGMLVDTFYSNENDAFIEAGLFLDNINRQLILLRTPEYEQLLLYDNHTGMIERVDIYSYERLKFVNARAAGNTLFVGFDKKVIAVDLLTMKQVKVWNQRAGEVLFDMEIEVEDGAGGEFSGGENSVERISVLLLLQWRMLCKRPKYTVLRGSVEEGFTASGERNVEYIEASLVKDLVFCNNDDIDYYGMDAISNQAIFTTRALGEQNGRTVLKRVFMFVKKPTSFLNSITSVSNSIYVMQFDENRVVTVRDYQEVGIFNKKTGNKTLIRVSDPNDPDNLIQILDCHLCLNDKLYCRTVDDKLIQVNAETGFLERTFDFMPGIIVSGCDFTGSKLSENMKQILIQHGGVFEG